MTTYIEERTTIKCNILAAEARKISDVKVINKSGRHKTQQIILNDNNAKCITSRNLKYLKKNKLK
ncbi:MAG: hypothetical protein LBU40_00320 [Methanobrevibacter sp.]|jgi:hypothetical protein|nr:hypothetical protein [Methanobrevibacter sp.]